MAIVKNNTDRKPLIFISLVERTNKHLSEAEIAKNPELKFAGFNKGTAVRQLMTYPPFAGRRPIFIGDDHTDEDAFKAMPEFNGLSMSVGRKLPGIDKLFGSPADVRNWLELLSAAEAVCP